MVVVQVVVGMDGVEEMEGMEGVMRVADLEEGAEGVLGHARGVSGGHHVVEHCLPPGESSAQPYQPPHLSPAYWSRKATSLALGSGSR